MKENNHLQLILTEDKSYSIYNEAVGESYHSHKGAYTESMLVFIKNGLLPIMDIFQNLKVFEMGFGTGLNALLTQNAAPSKTIFYETVEAFPLEKRFIDLLSYTDLPDLQSSLHVFESLHLCDWNKEAAVTPYFTILKHQCDFLDFEFTSNDFHLIYYDAFSMESQRELWSEDVFVKLYQILVEGGVLVTYSSKGQVKRALRSAGFRVERLAGPPGKRHVLRATKD
jgi:tRNA U34 5-methylaminomethyl-2-thiouridine-forming methyltransferase MnmC